MILIFANRFDKEATSLQNQWRSHNAKILTSKDLSVRGWQFSLPDSREFRSVVEGCLVSENEIMGVLTRWPCVYERELDHIMPEDRGYVASEMTAFLHAWLFHLKCPVINYPSESSLIGPNWRPEQWVFAAAKLGINIHRIDRQASYPPIQRQQELSAIQHITLTVIGNQCFGEASSCLKKNALNIAAFAGVDLLGVHFSSRESQASFISADLLPDLSQAEVSQAVLQLFTDKTTNRFKMQTHDSFMGHTC